MLRYRSVADSEWQPPPDRQEATTPPSPMDTGKPQRPPPPRRGSSMATEYESKWIEDIPLSVTAIQPHMIRWFYCEPGRYWEPFCGCDSMTLEEAHSKLVSDFRTFGKEDGVIEVSVLGDMYEVEVKLKESSITPIYWEVPKPWSVLRATWFEVSKGKYYPIKEEESELLEAAHCQREWRMQAKQDIELQQWTKTGPTVTSSSTSSASSSSSTSSTDKAPRPQVVLLHRLKMNNYEAVWLGHSEICKVKLDLANKLVRGVRAKIFKDEFATCSRLVRGYREPSSREDRPPPIGHVVFAIHGIGQNMDNSDVVKTVKGFRDNCTQVALKHFNGYWSDKRVEFIPIDWRTWLTLDRGTLDSITPRGVKSLRKLLNDSVIDVLYYMSPVFGPEMLDGFRWRLNKLYDEFIRRHPNFISNGGTVSLFGHSLGSVMCYDLMYKTAQSRGLLQTEAEAAARSSSHHASAGMATPGDGNEVDGFTLLDGQFAELQQLRLRVAALEKSLAADNSHKTIHFNVDHFFAVGSPLGLFIMMREQATNLVKEQKAAATFLPVSLCQRIYNLNHPSDPVAYRLEPLINSLYSSISPVKVANASSKPSKTTRDMSLGPAHGEAKSQQSWWNAIASSRVVQAFTSASTSYMDNSKSQGSDKLFNDDSALKPEDRLKERLDFMLKEGLVENSYLNSLTSHTCYWTSPDVAMFLLLQIYSYQRRDVQTL